MGIDKIDDLISLLENVYVDKDIKSLEPKERLNVYLNVKEFQRAKIQRMQFEPITDESIQITIKE